MGTSLEAPEAESGCRCCFTLWDCEVLDLDLIMGFSWKLPEVQQPNFSDHCRAMDSQEDTTLQQCSPKRLENKRAVSSVYLLIFLHMFSTLLVIDAKTVVYLRHFKGDTARCAALSAKAGMMMMGSALLLQPWLSLLSEAYGRKSLLLLGAMWSILARVTEAVLPIPRIMFLSTATAALANGSMLGAQSAIGDIFAGDAKGAGGALAALMLGPTAASVLAPTIGSSLALRNVRLPSALAICFGLVELMLVRRLPETHVGQRVPLSEASISKVNPLSFMRVFFQGPRLASLACAQFLAFFTDPMVVMQTSKLAYQDALNWTVADCGRYMSVVNLVSIPGMALGGRSLQTMGTGLALLSGGCASVLQKLLDSHWVQWPWQQYAATPLLAFRGLSVAALRALVQQAGVEAGMRQGELQGSLSSLMNVAVALGMPTWASWYAACARSGKPRRFFHGVAMVMLAQAVVAEVAALLQRKPCDGPKGSGQK